MIILDVEIKEKVYVSNGYNMYVNTGNYLHNKEFTKTYYIEDKALRLKKVRELLKGNDDTQHKVFVTKPEILDWQNYDFEDFEDYINQKKTSMLYNVCSDVSNKRSLEIEVYGESIFNKSEVIKKDYNKICFLIDQQYKKHIKVFDHPKSDFLYNEQYNNIIYDIIQNRIDTIYRTSIEDLRTPIKSTIKKPLIWNAPKTAIGTLFGVLSKNGIIRGHKTDIVRGLTDIFGNLSENTLTDNINLKINEDEAKVKYDKKTKELTSKWIEYLKK